AFISAGRADRAPDGPRVLHATGQTAWQRGWGLYSHVGYLARVVLTVTSTEPPVVHVYANGVLVLRRVPDWIAHRGNGSNAEHHAAFRRAVMEAVTAAIFQAEDDD